MTSTLDEFRPDVDPVTLGGATGAVFVPIVGLEPDQQSNQIGDMRICRLGHGSWTFIEKNRYIDFFRDAYLAAPKTYLLLPFSAAALDEAVDRGAALSRLIQTALSQAARLVLALRLFKHGLIVDPDRVVVVARADGMNYRLSHDRYRFYTAVAGDPITLPAKTRQLGDREIFFPQRQLVSLGGPPVRLGQCEIGGVERLLSLYDRYADGKRDTAIDHVAQGFRRAWDVMLVTRLRRVALLGAFETMFGRFGPRNDPAGVGGRVGSLWRGFGTASETMQLNVEGALREMRNAYAHGAERKRSFDESAAVMTAIESLRLGLSVLFALAALGSDDRHRFVADAEIEPSNWPVKELRDLLQKAARGHDASVRSVRALASMTT